MVGLYRIYRTCWMLAITHNGSLSDNLFFLYLYSDTFPRKDSNIRLSESYF